MATKKNEGGGSIRYDAFVKLIRPDPKQNEPISILHGYVGESASEDSIRLYSDETLNEYIDIVKSDILHSVPNDDDPLGGSKLWVKQNAGVKYTDGDAFAQGNMYDDYMGNMYDGGLENMGPGAATQICTIQPTTLLTRNIICRPSRFICPTPVSKLIICGQPRTIFNCPTIITRAACPQPSLVDGCPSAWGCTIKTGTTVINPTVIRQNEYSGGDVYNDYMQNMYDGEGGQSNFGPNNTLACTIVQTSPVICNPVQTLVSPNCLVTLRVDCLRTVNPRYCPVTCGYRTRWNINTLRCFRTIGCATDFTIPDPTRFKIPGGGIGGFNDDASADYGEDSYGAGDMYDNYMQNDYVDESMGAGAAGAIPPTSPALCQQLQTIPIQLCGQATQVWNTRCCMISRPLNTRCCRTVPWDPRCGRRTIPWETRCRITRPIVCFSPLNTFNQCQVHP